MPSLIDHACAVIRAMEATRGAAGTGAGRIADAPAMYRGRAIGDCPYFLARPKKIRKISNKGLRDPQ